MPLNAPGEEPHRSHPAYAAAQIRDLVAYIQSLGGSPHPLRRSRRGIAVARTRAVRCVLRRLSPDRRHRRRGARRFRAVARPATPTQIAEAIRIGPFVMPRFSDAALDQHDIDSITRYILAVRSHPDDRGGWSLGHLGPIPEGMVAWLIGIVALLAVARVVGEREP